MRISLLSVGRDRSGLFAPAVEEYLGRVKHYAKVRVLELKASQQEGQQARHEEGERLLAAVPKDALLVALDERGTQLTSREFANWLGQARDRSREVAFALGGDEGLSEAVRATASLVLSLSAMTLPHRLARLVLCEQVYRGLTLLHGEPYHRG